LMTFPAADEQPSVFFLHEDTRQSMLAVFNWTEQPRSHSFTLASLQLPSGRPFQAFDVLNHDAPISLTGGVLRLDNQPPHSVRLIKLVDTSVAAAAPSISAQVPADARAGEAVALSADAQGSTVPAIAYRWDFGDGTRASGSQVDHTYTMAGTFAVHLTVEGIEGLSAHKDTSVKVTGYPSTAFRLKQNRRYTGDSH
jgi:alpha-galactosidase